MKKITMDRRTAIKTAASLMALPVLPGMPAGIGPALTQGQTPVASSKKPASVMISRQEGNAWGAFLPHVSVMVHAVSPIAWPGKAIERGGEVAQILELQVPLDESQGLMDYLKSDRLARYWITSINPVWSFYDYRCVAFWHTLGVGETTVLFEKREVASGNNLPQSEITKHF